MNGLPSDKSLASAPNAREPIVIAAAPAVAAILANCLLCIIILPPLFEKTYKIDEESLLEEILITIREYFSCTMAHKGNQAIFNLKTDSGSGFVCRQSENKGEPMKRGTKPLAITAKKCRIEA